MHKCESFERRSPFRTFTWTFSGSGRLKAHFRARCECSSLTSTVWRRLVVPILLPLPLQSSLTCFLGERIISSCQDSLAIHTERVQNIIRLHNLSSCTCQGSWTAWIRRVQRHRELAVYSKWCWWWWWGGVLTIRAKTWRNMTMGPTIKWNRLQQ